MDLAVAILLVKILLCLAWLRVNLWLYTTHIRLWRVRNIPGPYAHPIVGLLYDWQHTIVRNFFQSEIPKSGKLTRVIYGMKPFLFVTDPKSIDHILKHERDFPKAPDVHDCFKFVLGNGLINSNGDLWENQRRLVSTFFRPTNRLKFLPVINEIVDHTVEHFRKTHCGTKKPVDVDMEMQYPMLYVFGKVGVDFDFIKNKTVADTFLHLIEMLGKYIGLEIVLYSAFVKQIPGKRWYHEPMANATKILTTIIEEKKKKLKESGPVKTDDVPDLMTTLLLSNNSEQQIYDEVMTFLAAGHETTAMLSAYTIYCLCHNPDIQEKLMQEIDQVMGERTVVEYEDIIALKYLKMVFDETLRFYPLVPFLARANVKDTTVAGYDIPANSNVMIPLIALNKLPQFWDEPEKFNPERFATENAKNLPKGGYYPFGGGRRECIGKHFAFQEASIMMTRLLQNFKFVKDPAHKLKLAIHITYRPRNGVNAYIEPREPFAERIKKYANFTPVERTPASATEASA
eukprot:TRINITY_DN48_c0_g1_i11.p1 TRINITY_DN48_c0_g1~~TRINITY_DN48_c0_g1_i11.p1  ORF type:complete len:514 (+),score=139.54 TRINITY_DN48_c0_g1_i11:54-1595(+)